MRNFAFFLLLQCFVCSLYAQQYTSKEYAKHLKRIESSKEDAGIIVSLDTIYNTGIAYAQLKKSPGTDQDYSVKDLKGNEVLYCRFNSYSNAQPTGNIGSVEKKYYYQFICRASKQQFETENKTPQQLAEFVVQNNILKNDQLNEEAVNALTAQYGNKFSEQRTKPVEVFTGDRSGKKYATVERDRKSLIVIRDKTIEQDGKHIGLIESTTKPEGVITYYVFRIMLPDKTLVAQAKYQSYGTGDMEIHSITDDKVVRIAKPDYDIDRAIVQYLIDNLYL